MDHKTYGELMEIQSALNSLPIIKSELSYETDDPQMTGNGPIFKKPISCLKCSKSFASTSKLKIHERIHTGEKPFSCSKCDKKFNQAAHLKTHERIHTDEKPFSCSKCEKKFKQSGDKKTHENPHWWKTIQLLKVQSSRSFEDSWKNSHWWETIQLL